MRKLKSPILVTGSHRSGTTWIGQTISQHPQVRYVHEPFNVDFPNPQIRLKLDTWYSHFESSVQKNEITNTFNRLLKSSRVISALDYCNAGGIDTKTPLRFIKFLVSNQHRRILVKDPIALFSAGWLFETYHFQVICMIRNPLAFVGSLKVTGWDFDFEQLRKQDVLMKGWLSKFADKIEHMCMQHNTSDLVDRAALLWNILHYVILLYKEKYPNWLYVKHEDVATNAELGFSRIFDYLDLNLDTKVRKYIEEYTSHQNPKEGSSPSYQPRNAKLVLHTWKERLSKEEIERVKNATEEISSQLYGIFV